MEREIGIRLTLLTFLILTLMGILIIYTGMQAVSTERRFFRDLTFDANHAVARMVAREFTQVFTNGVGLVEDMVQYALLVGTDSQSVSQLFALMLRRHPILRAIYVMDTSGKIKVVRHGSAARSAEDFRPLGKDEFARLARPGGNFHLSAEPYFVAVQRRGASPLAMTYAVRLEDSERRFLGVLAAEIDLEWIPEILEAVQVGHTGQLMVVLKGADGKGRAVFTSRNMKSEDIKDFHETFPVDRAFSDDVTGFEYGVANPKMASFATIHAVAMEPTDRFFGRARPFPVAVTPQRIPNWLIVVQQYAEEGYMVADRMKYNVIVLVLVGLAGALIITKLWLDSFAA